MTEYERLSLQMMAQLIIGVQQVALLIQVNTDTPAGMERSWLEISNNFTQWAEEANKLIAKIPKRSAELPSGSA